MLSSNKHRAITAAVVCAAVGVAGGIVGAAAAPSKKATTTKKAGNWPAAPGRPGPGMRHGFAVHSDEVVLNKAGDAFITETEDNGTVKSVSGNDVTITEGTKTVTYKDVVVTLPSDATIVRNGQKAAVSDLKAGDHIHVSQSSDGTFVFAADDSFKPMRGRGMRGPDHGRFRGPGGPPPGYGTP